MARPRLCFICGQLDRNKKFLKKIPVEDTVFNCSCTVITA